MPTTTPTVTATSSQGFTAYGVSGATKVTTKKSRTSSTSSKLDASTLALAHGSNRVYEDGLTDNGTSGTGGVVTVSMDGLGSTKPAVGSTITVEGKTCKCMESSFDNAVGELKKWSASYTSDYAS